MTVQSDSQILANLESALIPGKLALVEMLYTQQTSWDSLTHFVVIARDSYIGKVKGSRPVVQIYEEDGHRLNANFDDTGLNRVDFFDKYLYQADDQHKWKPGDKRFGLNRKYLPLLKVIGKMSAEEKEKRRKEGLFEWLKVKEESEKYLGSGFQPKMLHVYVNTDEESLDQYLSRDPFANVKLLDFLEFPIPEIVMRSGREEAEKEIIRLYLQFQSVDEERKTLKVTLENLLKAAQDSRNSSSTEIMARDIDYDDIKVVTLGDRAELGIAYDDLRRNVARIKEKNVSLFLKELEVYPGITIHIEDFLNNLDKELVSRPTSIL